MTDKVLITTHKYRGYESAARALLQARGLELIDYPIPRETDHATLRRLVSDAAGLLAGPERVTDGIMADAPHLRVICAPGVGYDHIDVAAATRRGIVVTTCPGANHHAVAEMALGIMLSLARQLGPMDQAMRQREWQLRTGVELWGKTLGIVGLGAIGKGLALRARAMGMRVLAVDNYRDIPFATANGISYVALSTLLSEADFVSLHCPLTLETRGLINAETLALMKPTAYLINTARGPLVDESALARALRDRQIAGAGLDVFVSEPPIHNPFIEFDNVILTPHAAGATTEAVAAALEIGIQNITAVLNGQPPAHRVN